MKFFWKKDRDKENSALYFRLHLQKKCDKLKISAVDFFQVFADGELCAFGPNRAPAGYSRIKTIDLNDVTDLEICVLGYNVDTYACDRQSPFFGAELYFKNELVYTTSDFLCYEKQSRLSNMPRYSLQRAFAEGYDYTKKQQTQIELFEVESPTLLNETEEVADYTKIEFKHLKSQPFEGFEIWTIPTWEKKRFPVKEGDFQVKKQIVDGSIGWASHDFVLPTERTGFLGLMIESAKDTQIYAIFEEYLPNGVWNFRRSNCNDFISFKVKKGKCEVLSFEPYAVKYLKILCDSDAKIQPFLRTFENVKANAVKVEGDETFANVFNSAKRTFCQNAVDIFTDCPGRERAGWLCDSYFTAQAERLFTGKNEIEKAFLQNYILADTPEIESGMIPMCFPAEHSNGRYIPNWAMWFIVEVCDYYKRTGDRELIENAKEKMYGVVNFFKRFFNEYGLLENLESWVFLEWSISNDPEYVSGVNFPSNMLYAYALIEMGELFGDKTIIHQANQMRETIVERSFNGCFFVDNERRKNGTLCRCDNHISETCQYYALFTGLPISKDYETKMRDEFGPSRKKDAYPEIGRSNMFIGNYLRFFWLCERGEYDLVLKECLEYFKPMAESTGTLWENDQATCSCNHGFASVASVLLLRCCVGYEGVKNGKPILSENKAKNDLSINITFNYKL